MSKAAVATDPALPRSFRRTPARLWMTTMISLFFLLGLSCTFTPGTGINIWSRWILYFPITVGSLYLTIREFRSGIFITDSGLEVRNIWHTYKLAWNEIAGFDRPARYGAVKNAGLRVRRYDGAWIASSLYGAGPFNRPTFADPTIAELEALRKRYAYDT